MKSRNDNVSKDRRKAEAIVLNETWAKLTPKQQIERLDLLKHNAIKQRAKIAKQLK